MAGSFHILRGLQELLKLSLQNIDSSVPSQKISGRKEIINEIKSDNINQLSSCYDIYERIRVYCRNPANLPEVIYNIEQVQDLFILCITVINNIVTYMKQNMMLI